jgi:hypothetical protein
MLQVCYSIQITKRVPTWPTSSSVHQRTVRLPSVRGLVVTHSLTSITPPPRTAEQSIMQASTTSTRKRRKKAIQKLASSACCAAFPPIHAGAVTVYILTSWRGGDLGDSRSGWRHTVHLFIPRECYCSLTCHRSVVSQLVSTARGVRWVQCGVQCCVLGVCHPHH